MKHNFSKPIIALDLATRTGYAHSDGPRGVWRFRTASHGHTLADMLESIENLIASHGCATIAAEAPIWHPKHPTGALIKIQHGATAKIAAARIGAHYIEYTPAQIKKLTTGNGSATKADMMRAVQMLYAVTPTDDNEADAIALLNIVLDGIPPTGFFDDLQTQPSQKKTTANAARNKTRATRKPATKNKNHQPRTTPPTKRSPCRARDRKRTACQVTKLPRQGTPLRRSVRRKPGR